MEHTEHKEHNTSKIPLFWLEFGKFVKKFILNKKIMLSFLALVVAVIIATVIYVVVQEKQKKEIKNLYVDAFYKYSEIQNDMSNINMERAGRAIAALEKVVHYGKNFPELYLAYFELGNIYVSLNKMDLAKKYYQQASLADKDFFIRGKAVLNIAKMLQNEEKYDEAIKVYEDIVADYKNFYRDVAYYFMGMCYEKKGNIDKAITAFKMVNKESSYGEQAQSSIEIIEQLKRLN